MCVCVQCMEPILCLSPLITDPLTSLDHISPAHRSAAEPSLRHNACISCSCTAVQSGGALCPLARTLSASHPARDPYSTRRVPVRVVPTAPTAPEVLVFAVSWIFSLHAYQTFPWPVQVSRTHAHHTPLSSPSPRYPNAPTPSLPGARCAAAHGRSVRNASALVESV